LPTDGHISGGVSVGTAQGDYTAKFKELLFDANKSARSTAFHGAVQLRAG
jgi:hypothetical protein